MAGQEKHDQGQETSGAPRITLSLACGEPLIVHRFSTREAMSSLFMIRILAQAPDPRLDLGAIEERPAAFRLALGTPGAPSERRWGGLCSYIRPLPPEALDDKDEGGLSTHELHIVPRLWLLTKARNHRIFQDCSVIEIVRELLEKWAIPAVWHVEEAAHPRLANRVQYGESDFAFVSRLLEEAGISYSFADPDDEGADSRLVLSDAPGKTGARRERPLVYIDDRARRGSGVDGG